VSAAASGETWPPLPFDEWQDTLTTLQRWTQMVGKTRLALAPMTNHWWQVVLYVTARGLTTSPMPAGARTVDIELDFVEHALAIRTSDGASRRMALAPRSVADFFREYRSLLRSMEVDARIWPVPSEMPDTVPFTEDVAHRSYDAGAARRCFQVLLQADRLLKEFRGGFLGKCSPVHFWWGGFDLSCTRFSGRRAPEHPGGIPNLPDWVTREAYSHECISAGWWPGGGILREPAFYAYAYPEPPGLPDATIHPRAAYYHREMREFILPYEAVRTAGNPDELVRAFLQSTYDAAADLAGWDRAALERQAGADASAGADLPRSTSAAIS
jgi:hypothetical protein